MSRRRIGIIVGGVVAIGLAILLRRSPSRDERPDPQGDAGHLDDVDAGPRWSDGRPVERPELYPARFVFEMASLEVSLHEDVAILEEEFCHPLARALCRAREACDCLPEAAEACEERERALCKRSLACNFLAPTEQHLGIDHERLRQCLAEVRDGLRTCRDAPLPEVCLRVIVAPVALGQPCPPGGRYCRGGVCVDGVCWPEPRVDEPCARLRTPDALPEEVWVCAPDAVCEPQPDGAMLCVDPLILEGMPCERASVCFRGQTCVEGRCGPARLEGEPCDTTQACDAMLACRRGECVPALRCSRYEDCGPGQRCQGDRVMRCSPPPGARAGEPCRSTRTCARGLVCVSGFCERGPQADELPIDGRCGDCCSPPRGPGPCIPKRLRSRGERCDGRHDRCDEGLACVPRTALDGGIALEGFECVTGLGEGAECVPTASRCRRELDCRPEYRNGRCLSTLCSSSARLWSCEGAPTPTGSYDQLQQPTHQEGTP